MLKSVADIWFLCALAERDAAAAANAALVRWATISLATMRFISSQLWRRLVARMKKDEAKARTAFRGTRAAGKNRAGNSRTMARQFASSA